MILAADVKAATSIREVISTYGVTLSKRGAQWWGLCPFHTEKTPSFSVHEKKRVFFCHGCGAGGDVIDFVRRADGLTVSQAVRKLAASAGLADSLAPHISAPQFELAGAELRSFDCWLRLKRNKLLARLEAIEQTEQAALHFADACWSAPGEILSAPGDHLAHVQAWAEDEFRRFVVPKDQIDAIQNTLTFAHVARAAIEELVRRIENEPAAFVQVFLREFYGSHDLQEVLS